MSTTSPETWTTAELVRAVLDIKATLASINAELRSYRSETVDRAVWVEFKRQIAADIVRLEAKDDEAARDRHERDRRIREDIRSQMRWSLTAAMTAVGIALTAAGIFLF